MDNKVSIEVSARHVHLNQEAADILYGKGHVFHPRGEIDGKIEYPVLERVMVVGKNMAFERVGIMFPLREETQVEISMTDASVLGIDVPVRLSGDLEGTPGVILAGPKGEINLDKGLIIAKRHLHVSERWMEEHGVTQNQCVKLRVDSEQRSLIFDDVIIRKYGEPGEDPEPVAHIDPDEANAAQINLRAEGTVII